MAGLQNVFEGYVDIPNRADRSLIVKQKKEQLDPQLVGDRLVNVVRVSKLKPKTEN